MMVASIASTTKLQTENPFISVPARIAATVKARENQLAISYGNAQITYGELYLSARKLMSQLRSAGVKRDVPVGVLLDRSPSFVAAALAVLLAGGAYVPLDPSYPAERLEFMVKNAAIRIGITDGSRARMLNNTGVLWLDINRSGAESMEKIEAEFPAADSLAYVIYTSGSTGRPKGVQIEHRGLLNLVNWHIRAFGATAEKRVSQYASTGFDAAAWEIWPCLVAGASLFIVDDCTRNNATAVRDWLVQNRINIAFAPTPVAEQLIQLDWPREAMLSTLLTGGDKLHRYPPAPLPFKLVNNYGPTEATVVTTSGEVRETGSLREPSIGRPIDNVTVRILDSNLLPVSQGDQGEIYVGGAGLARGYVDPDLTSGAFVASPFAEDGGRLYKTGDIGFYLPDGEIAFVGRNDEQIKIRGFRIEPNEIVGALNRHPAVQGSAVKVIDISGDKKLVAYVVPSAKRCPSATELLTFLRDLLPEYMLPRMFVLCDALPTTPNGKVDKNGLPEPTACNLLRDTGSDTPVTECQRQLLSILRKLLKIDDISLADNFFLLGGHSLLGAQLIAEVKKTFGVELALIDLFENGTLEAMAERIEQLSKAKHSEFDAA